MRHHYVPQFLLAQWKGGDNLVREFRLDLPQVCTRRRATKQAGYLEDLWALSKPAVAKMTQQAVETLLFKQVDNDASRALATMMSKGLKGLTHKERCDWVRFLTSLKVRQPELINRLRNDSADHLRASLNTQPEEYDDLATDDMEDTLEDWTEAHFPGLIENFGLSFVHEIIDNKEIGNKLLHMKWWLWDFSRCKNKLLLADNPCISIGTIDAPELLIALPISPTKAFMATRGERIANNLRRSDPCIVETRMDESSVGQARARVYACTTTPFRLGIITLTKQTPNLV